MNIDTNGFELGDIVRDPVTGFKGTITGIHQYLTGCARVSIQPPVDKDGKVPEVYGADVVMLEMVKAGPAHKATAAVASKGGPRRDPSRSFSEARR